VACLDVLVEVFAPLFSILVAILCKSARSKPNSYQIQLGFRTCRPFPEALSELDLFNKL
jgi:hypothetical protein